MMISIGKLIVIISKTITYNDNNGQGDNNDSSGSDGIHRMLNLCNANESNK